MLKGTLLPIKSQRAPNYIEALLYLIRIMNYENTIQDLSESHYLK